MNCRDSMLRAIIEKHLDSERDSIEYTLEALKMRYSPYKAAAAQPAAPV